MRALVANKLSKTIFWEKRLNLGITDGANRPLPIFLIAGSLPGYFTDRSQKRIGNVCIPAFFFIFKSLFFSISIQVSVDVLLDWPNSSRFAIMTYGEFDQNWSNWGKPLLVMQSRLHNTSQTDLNCVELENRAGLCLNLVLSLVLERRKCFSTASNIFNGRHSNF